MLDRHHAQRGQAARATTSAASESELHQFSVTQTAPSPAAMPRGSAPTWIGAPGSVGLRVDAYDRPVAARDPDAALAVGDRERVPADGNARYDPVEARVDADQRPVDRADPDRAAADGDVRRVRRHVAGGETRVGHERQRASSACPSASRRARRGSPMLRRSRRRSRWRRSGRRRSRCRACASLRCAHPNGPRRARDRPMVARSTRARCRRRRARDAPGAGVERAVDRVRSPD